ncbi:aldo/keto reductase family protein [Myxococcota bacterium]|nr:aldo/keto reductase family protein [Myxococcota bacterium]
MRTRALGRSGLRVSELSLGSWLTLGSKVDRGGTTRLVRHAFELGVNLFDTADVYSEGEAERALGDAIAELPRSQLVLATKCFFAMTETPNDRGLSRKHLFESVEGSLRRLRTDYLDLHQCHRFDPGTPLDETVRAYEDLIRQGKVLYWGVSHWNAEQVVEGCRVADRHGAYRPIANQPGYSILDRTIEASILPTSAREGLGQIVFSPLAQGALTGKYGAGRRPAESRANDPKRNRWMQDVLADEVLARIDRLRPIAAEVGCSMAQLALAWCLREPAVSSVLIGATSTAQLDENAASLEVAIPPEALARIDAIFPGPERA